jgi:hypothetical protein
MIIINLFRGRGLRKRVGGMGWEPMSCFVIPLLLQEDHRRQQQRGPHCSSRSCGQEVSNDIYDKAGAMAVMPGGINDSLCTVFQR